MRNRALLSAVAVCFIAAGCDTKKPADPPKPKTEAAVVPQDAKPVQLAQSGTAKSDAPAPAVTKKAAPAIPAGLKGCKQGNCKITLTVRGTGSSCDITPSPDPRGVFKDNKNDFMEWRIATADWEFDANGIEFPGDSEFSDGQAAGPQKYKVKNKNSDTTPTAHAYNINLKHKSGAKCSKDPSVVNDVLVAEP